jgi:thiosulfate/3-mercaptopyruvate sulfurtransferase
MPQPQPTKESVMPILAAWQFILLLAAAILATPLYRNGHIPGAVSIGDAGNVLRNPVTEDFIETALVENILGNAGIDPARAIIIYADYGNPYVYFGRLALRYFGAQQVRVFHDGI